MADNPWGVVSSSPAQDPWAIVSHEQMAPAAPPSAGKLALGAGEVAGSSVANIPYGFAHSLTDLYHRVTGKGYQPDPRWVSALHVNPGKAGQEFGPAMADRLEALSDRLKVGDALAHAAGATDKDVTSFEQNHPTLSHTVLPAAGDVATLIGTGGVLGTAARAGGEGIAGARALMSGKGFDVPTGEPTAADVGLEAPKNPPLAPHQQIGNTIAANRAGIPAGVQLSRENAHAALAEPDNVYARAAQALKPGPLDEDAQARVLSAGKDAGRVSKGSPDAQAKIADLQKELLAPKNDDGADWTGDNWLAEMRGLRRDGYRNITSDKPESQELGRAQLEMSRAIEDHFDRNLPENGDVDLPQLQSARQAIAENHTVQSVLRGHNVDMGALARIYRDNPGLLSDGLLELAKFGDENPELVRLSNRFAPSLSKGLEGFDLTKPFTWPKPLQALGSRYLSVRRSAAGTDAAAREFPARSPEQFAPIDRTPQAPEGMTAETPERPVAPPQAGGIPLADVMVARPGEPLATVEGAPEGPSAAQLANRARVRQATIDRLASQLPLRRGAAFAEGPIGSASPAQRANAANRLRSLAARIRQGNGSGEVSAPIPMAASGANEGYAGGGTVSSLEKYADRSGQSGGSDSYLRFLLRSQAMKMGLPPPDAIYDPVPGSARGGRIHPRLQKLMDRVVVGPNSQTHVVVKGEVGD